MEGVETESLSLGKGSDISPKFSVCLAENVEGFQQCVIEILKLIEQDGNFSEMTPESCEGRKSKLTTHVAELSRMHGVLVDQHAHLIGEYSKDCVSLIKKKHLDSYDSSSPQVTQMFTPDQMSNTHKFWTPIGFNALLSSGGGGGSYASYSLSSDSDSESFMSTNKLLISPVKDDAPKVKETKVHEVFLNKISNLEEELVTLNTKLQSLADENTNLKHQIKEHKSDIETQNAHLETEKTKVFELQKQVADFKHVISDSNLEFKSMGDELEASGKKLLAAETEISKLKCELSINISKLGSTQQEMALLQEHLDYEKQCNRRLQFQVSLCVADLSARDDQITELNRNLNLSMAEISLMKCTHETKEATWNTDIGRLKMELSEKWQSVNDLNKTLDSLKLTKDGITAQLDTLRAEKLSQDNLVRELDTRLNSIEVNYRVVLSSFANAQKVIDQLKLKRMELEREVVKQRGVISDRAEEKREVIRQLSFSLEHYMSGYKQLRQALIANKRHAVLTF